MEYHKVSWIVGLVLAVVLRGVSSQTDMFNSQCPIMTTDGGECFSDGFVYMGVTYTSCITNDHTGPWCATTADYDADGEWGDCVIKTMDGATCSFPVIYDSVEYNECTTGGGTSGIPWCYTGPPGPPTPTLTDDMWGYCDYDADCDDSTPAPPPATTGCEFATSGGNGGGANCVIPFDYKGATYESCITNDWDKPWCYVNDAFSAWGECTIMTMEGGTCVFPFTYDGVTYNECVTGMEGGGTGNIPYCSLVADLAIDSMEWGYCQLECPEESTTTEATTPTTTEATTPTTTAAPTTTTPLCDGTGDTQLTTDGDACIIPFIYKDVTYNECTTLDNGGVRWCYTTEAFFQVWGNCQDCPVTTEPTTATTTTMGTPTTTVAPTTQPLCPITTIGGTVPEGTPCAFPFTYQEVEYSECTMEGYSALWCSTDVEYSGNWGECVISDGIIFTEGGTAPDGSECILPFTYKGVEYTDCTTLDNGDTQWCYTTPAFQGVWGNCQEPVCGTTTMPTTTTTVLTTPTTTTTEPTTTTELTTPTTTTVQNTTPFCPVTTIGGSAPEGSLCAFPFTFKEVEYFECTTVEFEQSWCSTDTIYDGSWGECVSSEQTLTTDGDICVFPFTYQNVTYSECTDFRHTALWCSLTTEYDGQWGECGETICADTTTAPPTTQTTTTPITPTTTITEEPSTTPCLTYTTDDDVCVFPFTYNNVDYYECTMESHDALWCSITDNYPEDRLWGNCAGTACDTTTTTTTEPTTACLTYASEGSLGSSTATCVFPFVYQSVTYYDCTTDDYPEGGGDTWCYTAESDGTFSQWGVCQGTACDPTTTTIPTTPSTTVLMTDTTTTEAPTTTTEASTTPVCDIYATGGSLPQETVATCVFPFVYDSNTYYDCTTDDYPQGGGDTWCYTAESNGDYSQWGVCRGSSCDPTTTSTMSTPTIDPCIVDPNAAGCATTPDIMTTMSTTPSTTPSLPAIIPGVCSQDEYVPISGIYSADGVMVSGASTQPECEQSCRNTVNCQGYDFFQDGTCNLLFANYQIQVQTGAPAVTQYRLLICPSDRCIDEYVIIPGQGSLGGQQDFQAFSLDGCKVSCLNGGDNCVGFDFTSSNGCFLHTSATIGNTYTTDSGAQYIKNAEVCNTTGTDASQCFDEFLGKGSYNGEQIEGIVDLSACQTYCLSNNCIALDFNTQFTQCFVYRTGSGFEGQTYDSDQVDQYVFDPTNPNCNV